MSGSASPLLTGRIDRAFDGQTRWRWVAKSEASSAEIMHQIGRDHRALTMANHHDSLIALLLYLLEQGRIAGENLCAKNTVARKLPV